VSPINVTSLLCLLGDVMICLSLCRLYLLDENYITESVLFSVIEISPIFSDPFVQYNPRPNVLDSIHYGKIETSDKSVRQEFYYSDFDILHELRC